MPKIKENQRQKALRIYINLLDAFSKLQLRIYKHSKMFLLMQIIFFLLALISHEHEAIAAFVPPYSSVVVPVNKHIDAVKPLYSVQIMTAFVNQQYMHANFLIDLDAPFIWHECILQWNTFPGSCPNNTLCTYPASCEEYQCTEVRTTYSYQNPSCSPVTNDSTIPDWGYCTCPVNVVNPITGSCSQALLNYDELTVNTSNGRNVFTGLYGAYPNAACAPSSSFQSFPANVTGVMALSSSPYALPAYLYDPLKRIIALCLPSNLSAPGIMLYGTGPYNLLPHSNVDIRSLLSHTPLIKLPDSFGYFINVNSIVIKTRSIDIPMNTTAKISTIEPYTTLRTDIYNGVVRRFFKVTQRIPPAKAVAPFGLCFNTSTNGTQVSIKVPDIDFMLQDGKKWAISTANSIKQITKDVACLAFVDSGATSEPAIVIGTFQFEDNFVVFDLENSTFGFSSSLLRQQTSCSNFNFTLTDGP
ncbi:putative aspartic peptidase A1 family, aspartic peptidase domain superfamily, xylanase inhibitor [Helianthus annuus]|nr:putative aspartic peptidase A1 family, aspartic peptidase domain superfamily, xylanase inhibitor [Helianthus annuus]